MASDAKDGKDIVNGIDGEDVIDVVQNERDL